MKIVSRDYSIGQNTVNSKNETATNALLPKAYETQQTVNNNNALANTLSTVSNVANTIYNTYDKINTIATSENVTQDKNTYAATFAQQLTNAGTSTCSTWPIDTDVNSETYGARIADDGFSGILQSTYDRIDNSDYTADAKAQLKTYYQGVYDNSYTQFANQATSENLKMQTEAQNNKLETVISQRASAIAAGNTEVINSTGNELYDILYNQKGYRGEAYFAAFNAASRQANVASVKLEGENILKKDGYGALQSYYDKLLSNGAITQDDADDGMAKAYKSLSYLTDAMEERGSRDASTAVKAYIEGDINSAILPSVYGQKKAQELLDEGYSQEIANTYSASFNSAWKSAVLGMEDLQNFEDKVKDCTNTNQLTLLGNKLASKYPLFVGGLEAQYSTLSGFVKSQANVISGDTKTQFLSDVEMFNNGQMGYLTLDTNADKYLPSMSLEDQTFVKQKLRELRTDDNKLPSGFKANYDNYVSQITAYASEHFGTNDKVEKSQFISEGKEYLFNFALGNDAATSEDFDRAYNDYITKKAPKDIGPNGSIYGFLTNEADYKDVGKFNEAVNKMSEDVVFDTVDKQSGEHTYGFIDDQWEDAIKKFANGEAQYFTERLGVDFCGPENNATIYDFIKKQEGNGLNKINRYSASPRLLSNDGTCLAWLSENGDTVYIEGHMTKDGFVANQTVKMKYTSSNPSWLKDYSETFNWKPGTGANYVLSEPEIVTETKQTVDSISSQISGEDKEQQKEETAPMGTLEYGKTQTNSSNKSGGLTYEVTKGKSLFDTSNFNISLTKADAPSSEETKSKPANTRTVNVETDGKDASGNEVTYGTEVNVQKGDFNIQNKKDNLMKLIQNNANNYGYCESAINKALEENIITEKEASELKARSIKESKLIDALESHKGNEGYINRALENAVKNKYINEERADYYRRKYIK